MNFLHEHLQFARLFSGSIKKTIILLLYLCNPKEETAYF